MNSTHTLPSPTCSKHAHATTKRIAASAVRRSRNVHPTCLFQWHAAFKLKSASCRSQAKFPSSMGPSPLNGAPPLGITQLLRLTAYFFRAFLLEPWRPYGFQPMSQGPLFVYPHTLDQRQFHAVLFRAIFCPRLQPADIAIHRFTPMCSCCSMFSQRQHLCRTTRYRYRWRVSRNRSKLPRFRGSQLERQQHRRTCFGSRKNGLFDRGLFLLISLFRFNSIATNTRSRIHIA